MITLMKRKVLNEFDNFAVGMYYLSFFPIIKSMQNEDKPIPP